MNRNVESHFSNVPSCEIPRSKFDMSHSLKLTFNVGDLVPIEMLEVLPGDTWQMDTAKVVRMQTPYAPVMDNIYLDTYYFFCPSRILWEHWKEFMGENRDSAWIPQVEYTVPTVTSPSGGWSNGTIADYFGIPTGVDNLTVNALPFRAYAEICDYWFRDQNLTNPIDLVHDDVNITGSNGTNFITDLRKGGMPFKACKFHDRYTSALPSPQKGADVLIDVTGGSTIPVFGNGNALGLINTTETTRTNLRWNSGNDTARVSNYASGGSIGVMQKSYMDSQTPVIPYSETGLVAELQDATIMTINQLREAMALQRAYERLATGGSRYQELCHSFFGVTNPDSRVQIPEYLGGNRFALSINQVVQTSATQAQTGLITTPQGTTGAYSLTSDNHSDFTKSFTEHGYIIGVSVARYDHTYSQGIIPTWFRKERMDFFLPVFSHIGEQPVYNKEIYAQGSAVINPSTGKAYDDEVFGYQEAWSDYRFAQNRVTGEMRSNYATPLDQWHFGDYYTALPHLDDAWIREDKSNVDRTLLVQSNVANQLFADFFFECYATRPMPTYSVPGYMDHF